LGYAEYTEKRSYRNAARAGEKVKKRDTGMT